MGTTTETKRWDLSHVLDFVNTITPNLVQHSPPNSHHHRAEAVKPDLPPPPSHNPEPREFARSPPKLGDFSKIWQFLGSPRHIDDTEPIPSDEELPTPVPNKDDYASDGATYVSQKSRWHRAAEHVLVSDLEATDGDESADWTSVRKDPLAGLTKAQRKKARRKERKTLQSQMAGLSMNVSESEADPVAKKTPAIRASAHVVPATPAPRAGLRPRDASGKAITSLTPGKQGPQHHNLTQHSTNKQVSGRAKDIELDPALQELFVPGEARKVVQPEDWRPGSTSEAVNAVARAMASMKQSDMPPSPCPNTSKPRKKQAAVQGAGSHTSSGSHEDRLAAWKASQNISKSAPKPPSNPKSMTVQQTPVLPAQVKTGPNSVQLINTPQNNRMANLIPSSVQPVFNGKLVPASPHLMPRVAGTPTAPASMPVQKNVRSPLTIEPKVVRSGEDRHYALFMKILQDFFQDMKYLVNPMNLTTHNNDPKGIHVFIDASNIFIGFMDQLKRSRNIHPTARVPQAHLSFDALALLIERRRPVAKRVLAGSTPHLPAFDKAKAVGYECSILEKVYKARELTDRQIYFKELDRGRSGRSAKAPPPSNNVALVQGSLSSSPPQFSMIPSVGGSGSGSETNTPQYAPAAMIEQGVDEILHLKMLESVVDYDEPSIMVLATGDAASAEYSPGFMAMVERALKKNWTVELVSWSQNINSLYKKPQWINHWGERFRIVYLDDYAEELLDM